MLTVPHSEQDQTWFYETLQQAALKRIDKYLTKTPSNPLKNTAAYPVWLGNKMDEEIDMCVLCNLLCWIHERPLAKSYHIAESLRFIDEHIREGVWLRKPVIPAPYYPDAAIIAYHLARLCTFTDFLTKATRYILCEQIENMDAGNGQTRWSILQTARHRLHLAPLTATEELKDDTDSFSFFTAGMFNAFNHLKTISRWPATHLHYICPTFNKVLQVEAHWLGSLKS